MTPSAPPIQIHQGSVEKKESLIVREWVVTSVTAIRKSVPTPNETNEELNAEPSTLRSLELTAVCIGKPKPMTNPRINKGMTVSPLSEKYLNYKIHMI